LGGHQIFLLDPRRGLYSYAALQSRLEENSYAVDGLVDYSGPVLRLASLTPEDFYVLLTKLRHVQAAGDESAYLITDEGIAAYMRHCAERIGDAYFRTPRNTIKGFLDLLAVLEQNPEQTWQNLIAGVTLERETNPDLAPLEPNDQQSQARILPAGGTSTTAAETQTQLPLNPMNRASDDELSVFKL
jgi:hypothetical protein